MIHRATVAAATDLLDWHRLDPAEYPFLLQSVTGPTGAGRFDLLFAGPRETITGRDFLKDLNQACSRESVPTASADLPFVGGWFLLLGYELAGQIEPAVRGPRSPCSLPDALAVRCTAAVVRDHSRNTLEFIAETPEGLQRLRHDLERVQALAPLAEALTGSLISELNEEPEHRFVEGVRRILDYLQAGDVFQVNLSRGWQARLRPGHNYLDVYHRLRQTNPAPFAGLAVWNGTAVLSSSPERLVRIRDGIVETRPIAGTRPRGLSREDDERFRQRLIESFKERAEHIMLIDLERNDLGRVCEPGSIEVDALMRVESYAHVHHIVSNLRGRLRDGCGPGDVLRAVFPGGTITGCPKVRAMQIIAELEGEGRGPYTGAMGYLSRDGRMDTNILIRSLVCEGARVSLRTGAGIVADSQPLEELAETRIKARGMLQALGALA